MESKTWRLREVDDAQVDALQRALQLDRLLARILVARGIDTLEEARRFLDPRLAHLAAPTTMADLAQTADRLVRAIEAGETVGIFGDYDVDGVSATALLGDFLRRCGVRPLLRVARREEGYGFGAAQAEEMVGAGCTLVVLVDCGTSDIAAVSLASRAGVDVVALDHHQVTEESWPGLHLVNPQRPDCSFAFKGLTSVGLCFYLTACLRRRLERAGRSGVPDPRVGLDLAALGTVADVAPLTELNRILVSRGLVQLLHTRRPGLRELLRLCKLDGKLPSSEDVGWRLCPRLNAPGRMGDAEVALRVLWECDPGRGIQAARECQRLNDERRGVQNRVIAEALDQARAQAEGGRRFLMVADRGWHPGIIGIVASRLVDTFHLPSAVVSIDEETGCKGSARGVPGLDLVGLLGGAADLLNRYGGHRAAAGFSVPLDKLEELGRRLDQRSRTVPLEEQVLWVDGRVDLPRIDLNFCNKLRKLQPFGEGNPEPLLAVDNVTVEDARPVGDGHLRLSVRENGHLREAIGFRMGSALRELTRRVDLAFVPEINTFRGPRVQLRLVDLRPAGGG